MFIKYVFKLLILILFAFSHPNFVVAQNQQSQTILQRFSPPAGFSRFEAPPASFAAWLRRLPLQEPGSPVLNFRGKVVKKTTDSTVAAVVATDIKGRRLEQCMDILLRFYSAYLTESGKKEKIVFPLPDGLEFSWRQWRDGWRPQFKGLHFKLTKSVVHDSSVKNFRSYLNTIYSYTGSQTFYHHYQDIALDSLQAGDFIVRKNRKGHAVLILDMVENERGQKMILVGQGDTPACQFYILKGKNGSPWIPLNMSSDYLPLPIKKKMYWRGLRRFPAYTD